MVVLLTSAEARKVLAFIAGQQLVLGAHVRALLRAGGADADARLTALVAAGLVRRDRLYSEPDTFRITSKGLSELGRDGAPPPLVWHRRHAAGVAWLWLAAHSGTFGQVQQVLSEREMRALDDTSSDSPEWQRERAPSVAGARAEQLFGVRVEGANTDPPSLHYPDLILGTSHGRVVVELQLSAASRMTLGPRITAGLACYVVGGVRGSSLVLARRGWC
ncbi:MAG: hypothetical protein M3076_14185 [Actinomycetota bacterium]|nr:hypothetical protein [Actinomycetota bacterium]